MTARIQTNFTFTNGVHFNNTFYMNSYDLDVTFMVESEVIHEQNIALERIRYFLEYCISNSIFINQFEEKAISKYMDAGIRVCTLPEEPYDQIIGIMLLNKMNAITEGRLVVSDISICSTMSEGVSCLHSMEEPMGPFVLKGWWSSSQTDINDIKNKNNKVVKLKSTKNAWDELNLGYVKLDDVTTDIQNIVFATFDTKTDK